MRELIRAIASLLNAKADLIPEEAREHQLLNIVKNDAANSKIVISAPTEISYEMIEQITNNALRLWAW